MKQNKSAWGALRWGPLEGCGFVSPSLDAAPLMCRTLTDELSTAKEQCLSQFGTAVLVWCSKSVIRQSLSHFGWT